LLVFGKTLRVFHITLTLSHCLQAGYRPRTMAEEETRPTDEEESFDAEKAQERAQLSLVAKQFLEFLDANPEYVSLLLFDRGARSRLHECNFFPPVLFPALLVQVQVTH
jgi:hypothetical protein